MCCSSVLRDSGRVTLGAWVLQLALALCVLPAPAHATAPKPCGDRNQKTLAQSPMVRLYEVHPGGREQGVVYGCLKPNGTPRRLSSDPEKDSFANFLGPFAFNGAWAGGVEHRVIGQDVGKLFTAARNMRTGRSDGHCLIGGADQPGQLPHVKKRFLTSAGSFVWAALIPVGAPPGPKIGICHRSRLQIVDEGEEVDLESVRLIGDTLHWRHGSEHRVLKVH